MCVSTGLSVCPLVCLCTYPCVSLYVCECPYVFVCPVCVRSTAVARASVYPSGSHTYLWKPLSVCVWFREAVGLLCVYVFVREVRFELPLGGLESSALPRP